MTDTLERVTELLPALAKRAVETEQAREPHPEVVDLLAAAGCLRMLAPAEYGGGDLRMPDALQVLTELARADGSTAWVVGQLTLAQLIVRSCPARAVAEVFSGGPDTAVAGAVAPKGRATTTADGWQVTGQWPFVTGCQRAAWFYLNCLTVAGRTVQTTTGGAPATRIVIVPAEQVTVLDTWNVVGLRGTGSHDVLVTRIACPDWRGFTLEEGEPSALRLAADIAQSSLIIAAVATGVAAGALEEVIGIAAGGKRPAFATSRLAGSPVFQDRLGEARTTLQSAQATLRDAAERAWAQAHSDDPPDPLARASTRAAAAYVTGLACSVTDTAYALGGGTAVYDSSPLQRRLRDIHTATQHFVASREAYRVVGAKLAGEQIDTGPF